uniref:Uncharacterized protein n=1 Tax=Anguilla anguilla TaxID=7936 RepID=A0A0E9XA93_ANGAN
MYVPKCTSLAGLRSILNLIEKPSAIIILCERDAQKLTSK